MPLLALLLQKHGYYSWSLPVAGATIKKPHHIIHLKKQNMGTIMKQAMKTAMLSAALCTAFTTTRAQIYQNDFTSIHIDPNDKQWVEQHAIYRDDNEKAYYIAQGLRPRDSKETYLGITKCDADMNVIDRKSVV